MEEKKLTTYQKKMLRQMSDNLSVDYFVDTEYEFMYSRKWAFDYAIVELKIAIEYDGYVFDPKKKGGHQTPGGMANDMEKRNEGQIRGWLIILATQKTIDNGTFIKQLLRAIRVRQGKDKYE